jgi:uncharacterized protein YcfJ
MVMVCALAVCLGSGCQNRQTKAVEGVVIGGLIGAAGGGIIGHQSGHGGEGAGIGAAVGAITGAVVGAQMEKQPAQAAESSQAVNPNQMSLQQIADLTKQGVNESVIIDRIRLSNSKFSLSAGDIQYLKDQGVSPNVISAMQS